LYSKWTEYFKLQAKDYFGGRMLYFAADTEETDVKEEKNQGKDASTALKPVF
jgi:hypothetical protein